MYKLDMPLILVACLILINFYSFYLFWKDKKSAKNNSWRVSEMKLLIIAFMGGSLGAILGMNLFSHKTKKARFQIGLPFLFLLNVLLLYFVISRLY